jgi:putative acetyltransferase
MMDPSPAATHPEYLTTVLRRSGVEACVGSVVVENSRDTILSRIPRLRLTYDGPAGDALRSLIASSRDAARSLDSVMRITLGDLTDPRVVDLLRHHLASARAHTAPGSAHALDIEGLQSPDVTLWTAWDRDTLLAIAALKRLADHHGEVKSMHTASSTRRKGIGSAMLHHIITVARSRGMSRLSLETGSWDYFQPAVALYRKHGFVESRPFADYVQDPNSVFLTLDLGQ